MQQVSNSIANTRVTIPAAQVQHFSMQRWYGVKLIWKTAQSTDSLYYKVEMRSKVLNDDLTAWQISKSDYFINEIKPEGLMELLAIACADSYYPIIFSINKKGVFYDAIDLEATQQRFAKHVPTLLQNFGGDIADKYISQTQEVLGESSGIKKFIISDIWFSLFFTPITGAYNQHSFSKQLTISFPFWGYETPLNFIGTATVDLKPNEWHTHIISFYGQLDINLLTAELIDQYHPLGGNISLIYDLHMTMSQIKNIQCNVIVNSTDEIYELDINGYELQSQAAEILPLPE